MPNADSNPAARPIVRCVSSIVGSSPASRTIQQRTEPVRCTAPIAIDCRTNCEAIAIDPKKKTVDLRDMKTGKVTTESYDKLVLSPGAASVHPPLPGIDLPGIFHVRTVPDARTIREWIETRHGLPHRDELLLRHPDGEARAPGGGGGRRIHRARNGGEPGSSRLRRDPDPKARSCARPARPGDRGAGAGPHQEAWRQGRRQ